VKAELYWIPESSAIDAEDPATYAFVVMLLSSISSPLGNDIKG